MRVQLLAPFLLSLALCSAGCASGRSLPVGPARTGPDPVSRPADSAQTPRYLDPGEEVRVTVGTFPPMVGTIQFMHANILRLRSGTRILPLQLTSIRLLEVRRHRRTRAIEGGIAGVLLGGVLGRVTLIGIRGEHWESQGRLLAPGLGAILGGLTGALLGSRLDGDYWEEVAVPRPPRQPPPQPFLF